MMRSASLVSSAPASMASAALSGRSSSPSIEVSQRRTLATSSPWVSPSNDSVGMAPKLPLVPRQRQGVQAQGRADPELGHPRLAGDGAEPVRPDDGGDHQRGIEL